jgi:hypothetical protein
MQQPAAVKTLQWVFTRPGSGGRDGILEIGSGARFRIRLRRVLVPVDCHLSKPGISTCQQEHASQRDLSRPLALAGVWVHRRLEPNFYQGTVGMLAQ